MLSFFSVNHFEATTDSGVLVLNIQRELACVIGWNEALFSYAKALSLDYTDIFWSNFKYLRILEIASTGITLTVSHRRIVSFVNIYFPLLILMLRKWNTTIITSTHPFTLLRPSNICLKWWIKETRHWNWLR